MIRNDKDGTGNTVEKVELKVSQYGDDNKGFLNCSPESIDGNFNIFYITKLYLRRFFNDFYKELYMFMWGSKIHRIKNQY